MFIFLDTPTNPHQNPSCIFKSKFSGNLENVSFFPNTKGQLGSDSFEENKVDFTVLIENENSNEQLQIIDKSILAYALVEKNINETPKEVVIDECIRLAKKFSNEKAYKYVNAKADILYDL